MTMSAIKDPPGRESFSHPPRLCGGAGPLRQRMFAWMLARSGGRLEPHRGPHKIRLFSALSGTIVEIGPGVGAKLPYLPKGVKWIGVKPNPHHEDGMRE